MNTASEEERLRIKRERNKESARESRKRKKQKTDDIKRQITALEAANLQLRLQLNVGYQHEPNHDNNFIKSQIAGKLNKLLKEGATDEDVQTTIRQIQEKYSDYGVDRRSAISFHINQLRRALKPTLTTRTMLWLFKVAREILDPARRDLAATLGEHHVKISKLFSSLMEELQPTEEQLQFLIEGVDGPSSSSEGKSGLFDKLERVASETDQKLNRLEEIISSKNTSLEAEVRETNRILSGKQIAKFIIWVDKNPACMQLLEALWPHLCNVDSSGAAVK